MDWLPVMLNGIFMLISLAATLWQCRFTGEEPALGNDAVDETEEPEEEDEEKESFGGGKEGATLWAGLQALPLLYFLLRFALFRKEP